jgi:hypothetical protein
MPFVGGVVGSVCDHPMVLGENVVCMHTQTYIYTECGVIGSVCDFGCRCVTVGVGGGSGDGDSVQFTTTCIQFTTI